MVQEERSETRHRGSWFSSTVAIAAVAFALPACPDKEETHDSLSWRWSIDVTPEGADGRIRSEADLLGTADLKRDQLNLACTMLGGVVSGRCRADDHSPTATLPQSLLVAESAPEGEFVAWKDGDPVRKCFGS